MRLFNESPTRPSRGVQCYPILLGYAQRRQTVTYDEVADLIGYGNAHFIGNNVCSGQSWPIATARACPL